MNIDNAYILEDRGILFIDGKDAKEFLQNIITNDINKVNDINSCFASILTPQGKFLYDFLIAKHKKGFFIDCEKTQIDDLFKQLNSYKFRSDVQILNLSNEFVVVAINHEKFKSLKGSLDKIGYTIKHEEDVILLDPRNKKLGGRLIINLEKLNLTVKKLNLKTSDTKEYYNLSYKLSIPQNNMNKLKNKIFAIECNFEELNGIDFRKGCFVGQEITARIKIRNKLKRRLFALKIDSGKVMSDNLIKFNEKEVGRVLIDNPFPFAIIKTIDPDIKEFLNKELVCGSSKIELIKPDWIKL